MVNYTRHLRWEFREPSGDGRRREQNFRLIQRVAGVAPGNIQGIFKKHSGNIHGTFREHSGNIQETFREHSVSTSVSSSGSLAGHLHIIKQEITNKYDHKRDNINNIGKHPLTMSIVTSLA
jgi:hypothetical protein